MQKHILFAIALITLATAFTSAYVIYENYKLSSPLISFCKDNYTIGYERTNCLKEYFTSLTDKFSAKTALAKAINLVEGGYLDNCHLAAHAIGEENFRKNAFDLGKAFVTCPLGCIEGCYHGAAAAYMANRAGFEDSTDDILQVCESVRKDQRSLRQCLHGLGHGFLLHNSRPLTAAINLCAKTNDKASSITCTQGVFMENMNLRLQYSEEMLKEEMKSICESLLADKRYADWVPTCINAIGESLMFYTGHNLARSKELCESLAPEHWPLCKNAAEEESAANTHI